MSNIIPNESGLAKSLNKCIHFFRGAHNYTNSKNNNEPSIETALWIAGNAIHSFKHVQTLDVPYEHRLCEISWVDKSGTELAAEIVNDDENELFFRFVEEFDNKVDDLGVKNIVVDDCSIDVWFRGQDTIRLMVRLVCDVDRSSSK